MSLDDPSEFDGVLPVIPIDSPAPYKDPKSNAATGASAAGARAFAAQAVAFYFRAPVKAFFRTRVDYLAYARSINPDVQSGRFSWRSTTPGLLAHAIRNYGWRFIPEQLLPPLAANVIVGAALYTSYLQVLGRLYEPASHATKTVYPPAPPAYTFAAGFAAGSIQSVLAAPLDALQVRFEQRGDAYQHKTMWQYGKGKLHEIGLRGIFAGWGLSFLKDSFGSGIFFSTFEYVKAQGYYNFVRWYYGALGDVDVEKLAQRRGSVATQAQPTAVIRPHYALEPAFLMFAGMSASVAQQFMLYPLSTLQTLHYERLEDLDKKAVQLHRDGGASRGRMLRAYYHAYQTTWKAAKTQAVGVGMRNWLFRGFWWFTIRQIPSTSAGLVMFELIRRKYGLAGGEVRITKDGYDILLT
ncbi:mitochondrial carrier domain-containing protein [Exophiala viscosa]|uniref:mitochondrial carrier domain-containing protein n=1 Tax=Exophiala viscosa TaxID=2486360 RepID=UPI002194D789|nr:mitochondrial carrier domain-containing protein [Exophiala viscosa]